MDDIPEIAKEIRVVLARYGPVSLGEIHRLLGHGFDDVRLECKRLRSTGQATKDGGYWKLTRKGHLAVSPVKRWMEVPR